MALVTPRFFLPPIEIPRGSPVRFNAVGFVAPGTLGSDAGLAFPALPFTIVSGNTNFSNVVHVAGLRSFQMSLRLSAGPGSLELHPVVILPDATTVASEDNFATLVAGDGLKAFGWGALAGNGGGGGGVTVGGLDGRIYTHLKIGLKAVGGNVTVDRLDGLWCAAV